MLETAPTSPKYRFRVEIDGLTAGTFLAVTGLGSSIEVVDYREGAEESSPTKKLPGRVSFPNVVLKFGSFEKNQLFEWHAQWLADPAKGTKKVCRITLLDSAAKSVRAWQLMNAWPAKWTGPTLDADGNDVPVEILELACDRIEQVEMG
jgi:phage tail-like protein